MLERKWPLKLGMALEAELIGIGRVEVVSRAAAMRIVAIDTGHLCFAKRMVIGQIPLGFLLAVALETLVVLGAAGIDRARPTLDLAATGQQSQVFASTRAAFMNGVA